MLHENVKDIDHLNSVSTKNQGQCHWHLLCPCFFVGIVNVIDILVLPFSARGTQQLLLSMTDSCEGFRGWHPIMHWPLHARPVWLGTRHRNTWSCCQDPVVIETCIYHFKGNRGMSYAIEKLRKRVDCLANRCGDHNQQVLVKGKDKEKKISKRNMPRKLISVYVIVWYKGYLYSPWNPVKMPFESCPLRTGPCGQLLRSKNSEIKWP